MIDKIREIALKVLYEVDQNKAYSNIALEEALKLARKTSQKIDGKDIGFISEIVYGTISWQLTIDEIIKKHSKIRLKKISPWILNILRMSIYQIIFLDKVPKSAAVSEGVNLAKRYGHKASSNFVNAVLRKVEKEDYKEFFTLENEIERISKTTAMPPWMVEKLLEEMEVTKVEEICMSSNLKPQIHIRVNSLKTKKQFLIKELEKEKIKVKEGNLENFLILEGAKNIEAKKSFQEGKFTVQDEGAGLIPLVLDPKPNEKVLDACSSPGGKTTFMAELMENKGEIIAWDLHEHRVRLVQKVAKRLGIDIIQTEVKDATIWEPIYQETFDKILLDVPCLGLGVLKRKPDIKWQRKKEDIDEITKIQEKILSNCANYLKKGGVLVYSTCSILKEENEQVIQKFLKENKNFKVEKIKISEKIRQEILTKNVENGEFIQLYQSQITDGFFMAKLRKVE